MKRAIAAVLVGVAVMAVCAGEICAQNVNAMSYPTNKIVTVGPTTPTLLDAGRARSSLSIMFATNSTAGVGIRFFVTRSDLTIASQTNAFVVGKTNTTIGIRGDYINPAGTINSITVPVGWSYDATAIPQTAIYALSDPGATGTVSVTVGLISKP